MKLLEKTLASSKLYEASRRLIGAESEMRHLVDEVVRPVPGTRLLDFGCGNGRLRAFVPEVVYVGVDNNASYIEGARQLHADDHATFLCADVGELATLGLEPVDIVVCIGVLHHLDDGTIESALDAAAGLVRSGGRLVTMDPCFEPGQRSLARVLMALDRGKFVRHPADYLRLIAGSFDVQKTEVWDHVYKFPYTHFVTESTPRG